MAVCGVSKDTGGSVASALDPEPVNQAVGFCFCRITTLACSALFLSLPTSFLSLCSDSVSFSPDFLFLSSFAAVLVYTWVVAHRSSRPSFAVIKSIDGAYTIISLSCLKVFIGRNNKRQGDILKNNRNCSILNEKTLRK